METAGIETKYGILSLNDVLSSPRPLLALKRYIDQNAGVVLSDSSTEQKEEGKEFTKRDLSKLYREMSLVRLMVQDERELLSMGIYVLTKLTHVPPVLAEENLKDKRTKIRPRFKNIRDGLESLICEEYHLSREDFPLLEIYFKAYQEFTEDTGNKPGKKDWLELLGIIEGNLESSSETVQSEIKDIRQVIGYRPINWVARLGELNLNNRVVIVKDLFHNIHDQVTNKSPKSSYVDKDLSVEEISEKHQFESIVMREIGMLGELRREILRFGFGFSEESGMGNRELDVKHIRLEIIKEGKEIMETTIEEIKELDSIGNELLSIGKAEFDDYYSRLGLKNRKIFKLIFFNEIDIEYPEIRKVYDFEGIRQALIYQGKELSRISLREVEHIQAKALRMLRHPHYSRHLRDFQ